MLPKKNKLVKKSEIEKLAKTGKRTASVFFLVKTRKNNLPESRWVIVVSAKVHKSAVVRNRLRRQIRELVREHLNTRVTGQDVMIIARSCSVGQKYQLLKNDLLKIFK